MLTKIQTSLNLARVLSAHLIICAGSPSPLRFSHANTESTVTVSMRSLKRLLVRVVVEGDVGGGHPRAEARQRRQVQRGRLVALQACSHACARSRVVAAGSCAMASVSIAHWFDCW